MITLGIVLLLLGFLLNVAFLWSLGIILLIIGVALAVLGMAGREVRGRRHYW